MTKRITLFIFLTLVLTQSTADAQDSAVKNRNSIGLSFQKIDIGRGLQIDYSRELWDNWKLNAGLYVHINAKPTDDQNHSYHNRGWATTRYEHLGLNLSIQRNIISYKSTQLYAFYNAHVLRISYRDKLYTPVIGPNGDPDFYIKDEGYIFPPFVSWENSMGIGVSTKLSKNLGFFVRGGLGIAVFYDPSAIGDNVFGKVLGSEYWEGMTILSSGLYYEF